MTGRSMARVPPHSTGAEQAVLGGMMLAPSCYPTVAGLLSARDFYRRDHQLIFRAIKTLAEKSKPFDAVTLGEWFESHGEAELVAGGAYLVELASTTPSAANILAYAEIVAEKSTRRQLIEMASGIVDEAFAGEERAASEIVSDAIGRLMGLSPVAGDCEFTAAEAVKLAWQEIERCHQNGGIIPGTPTGLQAYDEITGGLHDGDLVVIGARPAMGKTALMVSMADGAADAGKRVGVFSLEQPATQLGLRQIAAASGVSAARVRAGKIHDEDWSLLYSGVRTARERAMWLYDRPAATLNEVIAVARKWKHQHDIDAILVDYAQRITVPGVDRITEVATVARGLKNLARELRIPVVALSQVVKGVDSRDDKRPKAGDLANSDELTREADQIVMLYRPCVHNPQASETLAELWIEKNRHGPTGLRRVEFRPATMRFVDVEAQ